MPAKSQAEQQMMAIALHHPEKLYKRNRGVLKMTSDQLREFASTPHAGLPKKKVTIGHLMKKRKKEK